MTETIARPLRLEQRRHGWRLPTPVTLTILILPTALLFFAFVIMPILQAARFSFYDWNGFGTPTDFVGLENYSDLFDHRFFGTALRNTGIIIAVSLLVQLPLALWLALALYRNTWVTSVVRTLLFLPFMLAEIAAGLMWSFVYDGDYGLAAQIASALGIPPTFLLASPATVMPAIAAVVVWKYFGFHMMIYVAALQAIPDEMIEAARLDGAKKWDIVRHVKIPMIRSAIAVSAFFAITGALQLFDLIVPLTAGGPNNSSLTIVGFLYQFGVTRMRIGFGGAISIALFVICVVVAVIYQRSLRRLEA